MSIVGKKLALVGKPSLLFRHSFVRNFVKVGDKVPVNYLKDEPAPVIKENSEYPDWVLKLGAKEPTLSELMEKAAKVGITKETFSVYEAKRLKRLMNLEEIKKANIATITKDED